ncbi:MAG: FliG C-terminal domain-containing protein [Pseudomonadota bacterium]
MPDPIAPGQPSLMALQPGSEELTRQQKAAVILGVLGVDMASPILEQLDEGCLRSFAQAMSKLRRVEADTVRGVIAEFLAELEEHHNIVRGGVGTTRAVLEPIVNENTLNRLLDDVDAPSVNNVWKKLAKVSEEALADFLSREHPQTAAVVLSKMSSEHAARVLNKLTPERVRDIVVGITKTQSLDPHVIEAIGASVSRDFLSGHQHDGPRRNPAERVGGIMNYTTLEIRNFVLGHIEEHQPEFADEVKRKMFTFEDIPKRVETRDVAAIARNLDQETLLRALILAETNAQEVQDYVLGNISSRVAEQLREEMRAIGKVRKKDGEDAQTAFVRVIREMEGRGELKLVAPDEDG